MGKPAKKLMRRSRPGRQYGALPYRIGSRVEVLLVTSRNTHRWVIPKGWPIKGKKPRAAAAQEAREEAGVVGKIGKAAIGRYDYVKRLANGAPLDCTVEVYPLQVQRQLKRWPEMGERSGHWFDVVEAAEAVQEPDLSALIRKFAAEIAAKGECG